MQFIIKKEVVKIEEKKVDVELKARGDNIILTVDEWEVFKLKSDGTGKLMDSIGSWSGLQIDKQGRIVLEN